MNTKQVGAKLNWQPLRAIIKILICPFVWKPWSGATPIDSLLFKAVLLRGQWFPCDRLLLLKDYPIIVKLHIPLTVFAYMFISSQNKSFFSEIGYKIKSSESSSTVETPWRRVYPPYLRRIRFSFLTLSSSSHGMLWYLFYCV